MGIKNLSQFLKKHNIGEILHVSYLKYKKLAIDTPMFFYKFKSCTTDWLGCFLNLIVFLRTWDIHPVFVFEGVAPAEKSATQEERRKQRQKIVDKTNLLEHDLEIYSVAGTITPCLQEVWNSLVSKTNRPLLTKSIVKTPIINVEQIRDEINRRRKYEVSITPDDTRKLKTLLSMLRVPYIESVGEAETDCVSLFYAGAVDYVMSEDTDVLAYLPGADSAAVKTITSFNTATLTFNQISKQQVLKTLDLTPSAFLDFCIMCGTDYNKNIFRVGVEKSYKHISTYHNIENVPLDTTILNYERVRSLFKVKDAPLVISKAIWCKTPPKSVKKELENFALFQDVGYVNIAEAVTALCDAVIVFKN